MRAWHRCAGDLGLTGYLVQLLWRDEPAQELRELEDKVRAWHRCAGDLGLKGYWCNCCGRMSRRSSCASWRTRCISSVVCRAMHYIYCS